MLGKPEGDLTHKQRWEKTKTKERGGEKSNGTLPDQNGLVHPGQHKWVFALRSEDLRCNGKIAI